MNCKEHVNLILKYFDEKVRKRLLALSSVSIEIIIS